MVKDSQPITFDRFIRFAVTALILCGLVYLAGYLSDVLIPFAVAMILAYMVNPVVTFIQGYVRSRILAVLSTMVLTVGFIILFVLIALPRAEAELARMGNLISKIAGNADLQEQAAEILPKELWLPIQEFAENPDVQGLFEEDKSRAMVLKGVQMVLPGVWGILSGTATLIMGIVGLSIIMLYFVFLLIDYERFRRERSGIVPPAYRERVSAFVADFESAMSQYFRGQALVAFLTGVIFGIGFYIIGLPLPIVLGLFIGLLNMVPYMQTLGILPAALLAVVHALDTGTGIGIVLLQTGAVFLIAQLIQDLILTPLIMGKVVGLSPAMILLSLSVWGKLLGLLGLVVGLPITFLLLAYYRKFLRAAEGNGGDTGSTEVEPAAPVPAG